MLRLMIKKDGCEHHYCLLCAKTLILQGARRLGVLLADLDLSLAKMMTDFEINSLRTGL
jgi:hypothetical protein